MNEAQMVSVVGRTLHGMWSLNVRAVRPWARENELRTYQAEPNRGRLFVKSVRHQGDDVANLVRDTLVQDWLHANGLPGNDVLATATGDLYAEAHGYGILETSFPRSSCVHDFD